MLLGWKGKMISIIDYVNERIQGRKVKSVGAYIFNSFLFTIAIVFILIWLCEVVLFDGFFKEIKKNQINSVLEDSKTMFNNEAYGSDYTLTQEGKEKLLSMSVDSNCNVVVFAIHKTSVGEKFNIYFSSSRITEEAVLDKALALLVEKLKESDKVSIMNDTYEQSDTIIMGEKLLNDDGVTMYYYVSTVVTPSRYTIEIMILVLLVVTLLGIIIMLLLGGYYSKKIATPLESVAQKAKQINAKNLDVQFSNREYKEVSEISDTLNYAITEIRNSEQIQKDVIANVSHELRTPLTMIKSYSEMIRDLSGDNPTKRAEHLKVILEEADRLEYLVSDLLDLSKLKAGTYVYEYTNFNLANNLDKMKNFYQNKYQDVEFSFTYPSKIQIFADEKRIEQVLYNFVNNAINYGKAPKKVWVEVKKQTDQGVWYVGIKDNGVGIAKEDLHMIFDRHFRSNNAKRVTTGSGIGLFIVKQILSYHNFKFGVESELGKGSEFYFEIPIK